MKNEEKIKDGYKITEREGFEWLTLAIADAGFGVDESLSLLTRLGLTMNQAKELVERGC